MCLITKDKQKYIATEDMVVYKKLRSDDSEIVSQHHFFNYNLNELYKTEIAHSEDIRFYDRKATVAYNPKMFYNDIIDLVYKDIELGNAICIGQGFHFILVPDRPDSSIHTLETYECIVPKGSEYYLDNSDLGVSNQIIIKGKYAK